jgi:hypothetical protein
MVEFGNAWGQVLWPRNKGVNKCSLCFTLRSFLICLMLLRRKNAALQVLVTWVIVVSLGTKVLNYSTSTGYRSASRILILLKVTKQDKNQSISISEILSRIQYNSVNFNFNNDCHTTILGHYTAIWIKWNTLYTCVFGRWNTVIPNKLLAFDGEQHGQTHNPWGTPNNIPFNLPRSTVTSFHIFSFFIQTASIIINND